MLIRSKTSGTLAQVSDDTGAALVASGTWESAEPETPKRRTTRKPRATADEKQSQ